MALLIYFVSTDTSVVAGLFYMISSLSSPVPTPRKRSKKMQENRDPKNQKNQKNLTSLPSNYQEMTPEEKAAWTKGLGQEILAKFRQQKNQPPK
jgi:hypothetical protein